MKLKIFALGALLSLLIVVPLSAQNCQAGLPCRQVPWAFPPLPILLSPSPIPTTVATAAPPPTSQFGLVVPSPTPVACPTNIFGGIPDYKAKVLALSPSVYYPMDETEGTTANDVTEGTADGTYHGVEINGMTWAAGGPAAVFDGVNDYVSLPPNILGGSLHWSNGGSILVWVNIDYSTEWTSPTERIILHVEKLDGFIEIKKSGANTLTAHVQRGASDAEINIEVTPSPDEWTPIMLRWTDYGHISFQVDVLDIFEAGSFIPDMWGQNLLAARVGTSTSGSHAFNGGIAHLAFFDRYLSWEDIFSLFLTNPTLPVGPDGCVDVVGPQSPIDLDGVHAAVEQVQTLSAAPETLGMAAQPVYDLYGNALNFFSIMRGLQTVDIGPFTPLVVALFAGFFLHVTVFIIEKGAPIFAVVIGVIRKLIQVILDFLPG